MSLLPINQDNQKLLKFLPNGFKVEFIRKNVKQKLTKK